MTLKAKAILKVVKVTNIQVFRLFVAVISLLFNNTTFTFPTTSAREKAKALILPPTSFSPLTVCGIFYAFVCCCGLVAIMTVMICVIGCDCFCAGSGKNVSQYKIPVVIAILAMVVVVVASENGPILSKLLHNFMALNPVESFCLLGFIWGK